MRDWLVGAHIGRRMVVDLQLGARLLRKYNKINWNCSRGVASNHCKTEQHNGGDMKQVRNWYIKDYGVHARYMSGMAIPVDADNITRNLNFVNCAFHPASHGVFENCQLDGKAIPDGAGCLWKLHHGVK